MSTPSAYPLTANGTLYDPAQVEEYFTMLFRHVDWQDGQRISLLGIGEKGTDREGVFKDREFIPPAFVGVAHRHLKRWAEWHAAGFVVPAVLHPSAEGKGDVTLDKVSALTTIVLDIDNGDVSAKAAFVIERLGKPTMVVASGGKTEEGKLKAHLYWRLSEPSEEVERVAALRKLLAAKVGGDQSFGRETQVIRIPGSVHAKNGKATVCKILDRAETDYDLDELADIIENMLPMPGLPPVEKPGQQLTLTGGGLDFTPRQDTAIAALHRDIHEGGEDLTRWGEFSKIAGFNIAELRAGRLTPEQAYLATSGWVLSHMIPPWPQQRIDQEFRGLLNKDMETHGLFPATPAPWSNVQAEAPLPLEYFGDIKASLSNAWLVRGLFPLAGLGLIYGSPGAGKSFFAIDVALRIAAGWPVDGRAVQQCPVIYIAAEGQKGLRGRVAAFRLHHAIDTELPFALVPCALDLLDPKADLPRLIEAINTAAERFGLPPGLIVVDTLAATFGGGDENTSAMITYINNLAKLRDAFDATVLTVHHRPKDQLNDTPRGHSSLMGAMDTIVRVDGAGMRVATTTKQKDGENGEEIHFSLLSIKLGDDEEGEPVLSAIVEYSKAPTTEKLPQAARDALQALADAMAEASGAPVSEKAWRSKWQEGKPQDTKEETLRKAWARNRDKLRKSELVYCDAGLWSPTAPPNNAPSMDFSPTAGAGQ